MPALEGALGHSRRLGIDECELVSTTKQITTVRITDSEIAEVKQGHAEDYGARLIHKGRVSSARTAIAGGISGAIDRAYGAMPDQSPAGPWPGLPSKAEPAAIERAYDRRLDAVSGSDAADIAQAMINAADDPRMTVTGSLNIVSEEYSISNSNGLEYVDRATYVAGIINSQAEDGPASGMGHDSGRTLSGFSAERVGADAREMCSRSLRPQRVEPGRYSVIFEPYSVGEILAFVAAPNFGQRELAEKRSCFSGRFGDVIASEQLTLVDDPHAPDSIGSRPVDDEGMPTQRRELVRDGRLAGTFANLRDGHMHGHESTGNASRAGSPMGRSSEPVPHSAPHNLVIEPGSHTVDEMVRDTRKGLLVGRLWYTYAVNPARGDFSCTARSGVRIIRDGQVQAPGGQVRIIHNLPRMLGEITAIGREQRRAVQWASLPSIVPHVRAENIRVEPI